MTRTQGPSTANLADSCLRLGIAYWTTPLLRPATANCAFSGRARPVRHFGSVDIFLEAIARSEPGDVLVVDNDGRDDEGCIGDLIALEAATAKLAAIVIWGRHRDTPDLPSIPIALFSLGSCPSGPRRLDAPGDDRFESARIGALIVTRNDMVAGDSDGLVFFLISGSRKPNAKRSRSGKSKPLRQSACAPVNRCANSSTGSSISNAARPSRR